MYNSTVSTAPTSVAQYMRNIAMVHLANLGTRFLYTTAPYNSFDTHAGECHAPTPSCGPTPSPPSATSTMT